MYCSLLPDCTHFIAASMAYWSRSTLLTCCSFTEYLSMQWLGFGWAWQTFCSLRNIAKQSCDQRGNGRVDDRSNRQQAREIDDQIGGRSRGAPSCRSWARTPWHTLHLIVQFPLAWCQQKLPWMPLHCTPAHTLGKLPERPSLFLFRQRFYAAPASIDTVNNTWKEVISLGPNGNIVFDIWVLT